MQHFPWRFGSARVSFSFAQKDSAPGKLRKQPWRSDLFDWGEKEGHVSGRARCVQLQHNQQIQLNWKYKEALSIKKHLQRSAFSHVLFPKSACFEESCFSLDANGLMSLCMTYVGLPMWGSGPLGLKGSARKRRQRFSSFVMFGYVWEHLCKEQNDPMAILVGVNFRCAKDVFVKVWQVRCVFQDFPCGFCFFGDLKEILGNHLRP